MRAYRSDWWDSLSEEDKRKVMDTINEKGIQNKPTVVLSDGKERVIISVPISSE